MKFERSSSELSFTTYQGFTNPSFQSLDYWQCEYRQDDVTEASEQDRLFLYDLMQKILHRGERTFPTRLIESLMGRTYGKSFQLLKKPNRGKGSITYMFNPELQTAYQRFTDFVEPWGGRTEDISFDPNHPENERRLFTSLVRHFGTRIAHYIYTQVPINSILSQQRVISLRNDLTSSYTSQMAMH
jgi:hypothetical protein